jgi:hypothetical protein
MRGGNSINAMRQRTSLSTGGLPLGRMLSMASFEALGFLVSEIRICETLCRNTSKAGGVYRIAASFA